MNMFEAIKTMRKTPVFCYEEHKAKIDRAVSQNRKQARTDRRLNLAKLLKANSGKWKAPQLAIEMGVTAATIRADIECDSRIIKQANGRYIWKNKALGGGV